MNDLLEPPPPAPLRPAAAAAAPSRREAVYAAKAEERRRRQPTSCVAGSFVAGSAADAALRISEDHAAPRLKKAAAPVVSAPAPAREPPALSREPPSRAPGTFLPQIVRVAGGAAAAADLRGDDDRGRGGGRARSPPAVATERPWGSPTGARRRRVEQAEAQRRPQPVHVPYMREQFGWQGADAQMTRRGGGLPPLVPETRARHAALPYAGMPRNLFARVHQQQAARQPYLFRAPWE